MVVGIDLHEETTAHVTVETSDGKVWVIVHVFYPMRILRERDKHPSQTHRLFVLNYCTYRASIA